MNRPLRCLLVSTIVAAILAGVAAAAPVSEDAPVPGGRSAFSTALNIDPVPDRAAFVAEAVRLLHGASERKALAPEVLIERLRILATAAADEELVPVPLTAAVWSDAIFRRRVPRNALVGAILGDRQASFLAHGLASLDDQTLEYLGGQPALLAEIYARGAAPFAVFASALRVHAGRVVPPGGEEAPALWEAVVGERVTRPDRFISALYVQADDGLAALYDTVAHLDGPRQRFALGLWIADPLARAESMHALVAAAVAAGGDGRTMRAQPFARQPYDLAATLARVRVDVTGRPLQPASRDFWSRVLESADLPADPTGAVEPVFNEQAPRTIDAAWVARLAAPAEMRMRAEHLDQFAFGQRVFASVSTAEGADAFVAIRAFRRYRMLMMTLERLGIRNPATYAAAARVAARVSSPDAGRAFLATAQFQGALVLLWRMRQVGSLDAGDVETLLGSLLAAPLNASSQYRGGIIRWLDEQLRPAIPAAGSLDEAVEAAVAGPDDSRSAPRVVWEGKRYRVDLAAAEARRVRRIREKQGGATLDVALDLAAAARRLSTSAPTAETVAAASAQVGSIARQHFGRSAADPSVEDEGFPPGVAPPPAPRRGVLKALDDLGRGSGASNVPRAASELADAADAAAAQALVSLAYAINLGDPDGAALLPGNVSRRHDFGFNQRSADQRHRAPWMIPRQDVSPGVPWHVDGSLLGLDVALAPSAMRRLRADGALAAPTLTTNERETFVVTFGLIDPRLLTDTSRDAIAEAIERGRRRVALVRDADDVASIAEELNLDGWRRRAIAWTVSHDRPRLETMISLRELLALGHGDTGNDARDLDTWGTSALLSDGCMCLRMPSPGRLPLVAGRHQIGLLATAVPDVNLHVARTLSLLRLPARLAKYVLSAAVLDFVDEVRGTDPDDWLSLVRRAAAVPRDRIEDYVAAAAADGPLITDSAN